MSKLKSMPLFHFDISHRIANQDGELSHKYVYVRYTYSNLLHQSCLCSFLAVPFHLPQKNTPNKSCIVHYANLRALN
jgi:hypothetical protein